MYKVLCDIFNVNIFLHYEYFCAFHALLIIPKVYVNEKIECVLNKKWNKYIENK